MIDLNAIANSAVVASQHQVNRTSVIQTQNNAVKMEQELKPAPSNVIQKLTIPQLIGYMQNADEISIRKLFRFLSKEQVVALQGINSQIEDEELREVIANYSAPDDDFDDVPDDAEVESADIPISDDEDVDVFDDSEVESVDALAPDDEDAMFDEDIESSDENVSALDDDLFDDEDELSSEDEELVDLDDNNSFITDDVDDIGEDSPGQEEPTSPQGTIEPTLVVPVIPQGIIESVESDSSPSDMDADFDDIPEDEFDSEDFDDIAEDESQVNTGAQSVNDFQPLVEPAFDEDFDDLDEISDEDTPDNFDDIPDDEFADEVAAPQAKIASPQVKIASPRVQVATPLLDELVNPASQGTIGSSDTKSVQDLDAFDENFDDEFDEVESDSSDDFDDFDAEDDTVDVDEVPVNLVDNLTRVAPATSKIASFSPVTKPVVEPEPDIAVQDEVLEEPVIEKPVSRQSTKHLGSPGGTTVPSRKSVSSGQVKKSAVQSEFSSAFKGIRGLDDIEDITEAIEIPVKRATKSIDTKPQAQLPCSDGVVESKGKAGSTLSRDPSIPEPTVGELYEKGWTLMTYMSKNRGNKAAMHLDVVGKYFPMAVIKAGEARGKFTIHKNYLRK